MADGLADDATKGSFSILTIVNSTQDEDCDSDDEVVKSGVQRSFADLLVVKDWLKRRPDRVKRFLKTLKIWAPILGGRLPYKDKDSAA